MCKINQNFFVKLYSILESKYVLTYVYRFLFVYSARSATKVQKLKTAAHQQIKKVKTQHEVDRNKNSDVKNSRKNPKSSFVVLLTKFFINGRIAKAFYFLCLQF